VGTTVPRLTSSWEGHRILPSVYLAVWLACTSAVPAENIVANPGFEAGQGSPSGWNFNHRGTDGIFAWVDSRSANGDRSVMLTNVAKQSGNVVQTVRLGRPLPPGSHVTYRAMSATKNTDKAPRIVMYLRSPGGNHQTVSTTGAPGTHDFVPVGDTVVTDRPVSSIVIYLCHYGIGTAWWDDAFVSVKRAKETIVIDRRAGTERLPPLATADGLCVRLNDAGGVVSVRLDGNDLLASGMRSGLWVRPLGSNMVPVTGEIATAGSGLVQRWKDDNLGLGVVVKWLGGKSALHCRGELVDLTGKDRCVDVVAAVPVGAAGEDWRWGRSVIESIPVWRTAKGKKPTAVPQALEDYTFSALSRPDDAGLSLAVPADSPCVCRFEWDPEFGLSVRFRFGLSPHASGDLKSRAPFAFTISRIDPAWPMRDAARRYQQRNPKAFEKRVKREGLWMFGRPRIELPDPHNYAFHEAGPTGWQYDEEHDISTCPYIIPGQREITKLKKLPADAAEALEIFERWKPGEDRRGRGWGNKRVIETSMLHDANGKPVVEIRNTTWGGNSITFPLNANPRLFGASDKPTIAKTLLKHARRQHDQIPQLDGTYVDSLGHWGRFVNFRREHFAAERIPLTCDPVSGRPVINNRFTLLQFLWELRDLLHERGKLLFANGVHPNRRFHFFALDVMGVEGHGRLYQKRTMAGPKPFLLLIYRIHEDPAQMEYWFNRCVHWGIYPSFGNMRLFDTQEKYAPIARLNNRYVPALRAITSAGWQPVTHAHVTDRVLVERWGPGKDGRVYLTVYPDSEALASTKLTIDAAALQLEGASLTAEDVLAGGSFQNDITDGSCGLKLPLHAERVRVLKLTAR